MLKQDLRKIYLEKRRNLTTDEVKAFSERIYQNFIRHFEVRKGAKIHIFQSIPKFNEVDTSLFINYFFKKGAKVYVPKMNGEQLLAIEITPETDMAVNSWGILEPLSNRDAGVQDYDFVITPLLYCDAEGNRVGYGKGFYDRFFAGIESESQKIGVGFFTPQDMVTDLHPGDVPLDYLVTPAEVLSFGNL